MGPHLNDAYLFQAIFGADEFGDVFMHDFPYADAPSDSDSSSDSDTEADKKVAVAETSTPAAPLQNGYHSDHESAAPASRTRAPLRRSTTPKVEPCDDDEAANSRPPLKRKYVKKADRLAAAAAAAAAAATVEPVQAPDSHLHEFKRVRMQFAERGADSLKKFTHLHRAAKISDAKVGALAQVRRGYEYERLSVR